MLVIVEAPESARERAVAAGATQIGPVETEHRRRVGRIEDPFGHHRELGTLLIE